MALIKQFDTEYGPSVKANYFYINQVEWQKGGKLRVGLSGHASKEDRQEVPDVALLRKYAMLEYDGDIPTREVLYGLVKELPEWEGATDDV